VVTTDDRWKTFWLRGYGRDIPRNRARCPETSRLLEGIPGLTTAMFSILRGPKRIAPHCGPYAGVLRLHLALKVPKGEGESWIRVGPDRASWEEGRCLIFDDTHEHEVRHDVPGDRVVLFVDFLRPLPWPLSTLNRTFVAAIAHTQPFVVQGFENHAKWEAEFGQTFDLEA
jgi:beta-hydroxylase